MPAAMKPPRTAATPTLTAVLRAKGSISWAAESNATTPTKIGTINVATTPKMYPFLYMATRTQKASTALMTIPAMLYQTPSIHTPEKLTDKTSDGCGCFMD